MATPMLALSRITGNRATRRIVVHRRSKTGRDFSALAKGAEALTIESFSAEINAAKMT
jgi:hypothetical protein